MMYGSASEDYLLLLESLGDFFEKEIEPTARENRCEGGVSSRETFGNSSNRGFTSMGFPKDFGGLELPWPITSRDGDVREGLRQHRSITRYSWDLL